MAITGIICEYNPLHLGHKKQLDTIRAADPTSGIVCLMSGNFVQRGMPAVFDKMTRAKAAVRCGADLVLELPITAALSSAEAFASRGVEILSRFCDELCFGAENADEKLLTDLAKALLCDTFPDALRTELDKGLSFPSARQAALEKIGLDSSVLALPNNILAVEYCKAIVSQGSPLKPHVILREGGYHDTLPDPENPSATALRTMIEQGTDWTAFVPSQAAECFKTASVHNIKYGERAVLGKLRTMSEEDYEALPYGSEGLWRKLMHAARQEATLDNIIAATKSKRYTRTRIDRMIVCAFLGVTEQTLTSSVPYVRVLAFNDRGRQILKSARSNGIFINIGEKQNGPYQDLEDRCGDLYGLFADQPERPGRENENRVYYHK